MKTNFLPVVSLFCFLGFMHACSDPENAPARERIILNDGWRFFRYASMEDADSLIYDLRPDTEGYRDDQDADTRPEAAVKTDTDGNVLKAWVLPTANGFIKEPSDRHTRPEGDPGSDFPFVQADFDDSSWNLVRLPHDWAIRGPFMEGHDAEVGGGMGRLPSHGVAWYRKKLHIQADAEDKSVFLDVDGAMSYAMVWINGHLAGGWPYGYNSWRVDLTPYVVPGGTNQLAIRLDNPSQSSRWYPGGGLYRNVWLTITNPLHVSHWGTCITTSEVSPEKATVHLEVSVDNQTESDVEADIDARVFAINESGDRSTEAIAEFETMTGHMPSGKRTGVSGSLVIRDPELWGPPPNQTPSLYVAEITVSSEDQICDTYETVFGIRDIVFDAEKGVIVNGEPVQLKGANQHHDLGALGAAFNTRAAERQLEILREMGCNAIRMAHNPPAPELLELTDRMGFLVINEIFDVWERRKTPLDFHLIFPDWHEADTRAFIRRDRNHPSVIMWSLGNEVGEQYTGEEGAAVARRLHEIAKEEDPSRPTTVSMNFAKPHMALPPVMDVITLNYQGEGIRNAPAYAHLRGISTPPLYPAFHEKFPEKVIISSENAAAVSSRGTFTFPVTAGISAPVSDGVGADPKTLQVSAYELYTAPFGSSADKVFASLERHPYVAGGFVWSGWDYLGEPTPYYLARSSYFGVIDLAGFPKERYYLYQAHWRPDLPMARILPHWNWPERVGQVTPVHVFTSGDEAELFLNGNSLGRKKKGEFQYRLRWDDVRYEAGELEVVAYKDGHEWARDKVKTTGQPSQLRISVDRDGIMADGSDLAFVTVEVCDKEGMVHPLAGNLVTFTLEGPGEIVATDNGDPTCMTAFPSKSRKAFNGRVLAVVRAEPGKPGTLVVHATSNGLEGSELEILAVTE